MTPIELDERASALYGNNWQSPLSRRIKLDSRTVRRWRAGDREIPDWLGVLLGLLEMLPDEVQNFPDRPNREAYKKKPEFTCSLLIRGMLARVLKITGGAKEDRSHAVLGYSPKQLRLRIECQFKDGMSWANHGDWHVDHRKPVARFIRQGITDPRIINSLCNIQPLWGPDNLSKGDTWPLLANDNTQNRVAA